MNINRIFNHLFSGDKKNETGLLQKKNRETDQSHVNVKQISLNNVDATQNIELTFKQIQAQLLKEKNPHQFDANRVIGVLNGEKTGRLDTMTTEVLKSVISEENRNAVATSNSFQQIKNIISQKIIG